jgi:putative FmdB family regulatory protein
MPIYEYVCEKCGKKYNVIFKIDEDQKTIPCDCGHKEKKIISVSSFVLKGTGWAKDGYSK